MLHSCFHVISLYMYYFFQFAHFHSRECIYVSLCDLCCRITDNGLKPEKTSLSPHKQSTNYTQSTPMKQNNIAPLNPGLSPIQNETSTESQNEDYPAWQNVLETVVLSCELDSDYSDFEMTSSPTNTESRKSRTGTKLPTVQTHGAKIRESGQYATSHISLHVDNIYHKKMDSDTAKININTVSEGKQSSDSTNMSQNNDTQNKKSTPKHYTATATQNGNNSNTENKEMNESYSLTTHASDCTKDSRSTEHKQTCPPGKGQHTPLIRIANTALPSRATNYTTNICMQYVEQTQHNDNDVMITNNEKQHYIAECTNEKSKHDTPKTANITECECKQGQNTVHDCTHDNNGKLAGNNILSTSLSTDSVAVDSKNTEQYPATKNNNNITQKHTNKMTDQNKTLIGNPLKNAYEDIIGFNVTNASPMSSNETQRTTSQLTSETKINVWCRTEEKTCIAENTQTRKKETKQTSKPIEYPGIPHISDSQIDSKIEQIMSTFNMKK